MADAPALARRFYKTASVKETPDGVRVMLDERMLRTPGGAVFTPPTRALAQLCADEWAAQGEHIVPASMPISQLAFAAFDWTSKSRDQITRYVAQFGETDLCCHRATSPPELAAKQAAAWDPLVDWADEALGVRLPVVTGVMAARVMLEELDRLRAHADALDDFRLTALGQAAGLAGSAVVAFALVRGRLTPERAFAAAALDNLWSLDKWGDDAEARARLDRQRTEFEALGRFLTALSE